MGVYGGVRCPGPAVPGVQGGLGAAADQFVAGLVDGAADLVVVQRGEEETVTVPALESAATSVTPVRAESSSLIAFSQWPQLMPVTV